MTQLNDISTLILTANQQIEAYSNKPTKAESARIRKTLGAIKNLVTPVRAELVAADKK